LAERITESVPLNSPNPAIQVEQLFSRRSGSTVEDWGILNCQSEAQDNPGGVFGKNWLDRFAG